MSDDNPPDTTNDADRHNTHIFPWITLIPSSFYVCPMSCLSSRDIRRETKHQDLKALAERRLLLIVPPLFPHPPSLLCLSLIFNLTWTVINASPVKREKHKGFFFLPLVHTAPSAVHLSSIFNDFFISGLSRTFFLALLCMLC